MQFPGVGNTADVIEGTFISGFTVEFTEEPMSPDEFQLSGRICSIWNRSVIALLNVESYVLGNARHHPWRVFRQTVGPAMMLGHSRVRRRLCWKAGEGEAHDRGGDRPGSAAGGSPLRTPRAAAVAGIIFSVLLITALTLLRLSFPPSPGTAGIWLTDSAHRAAVAVGLSLDVLSADVRAAPPSSP